MEGYLFSAIIISIVASVVALAVQLGLSRTRKRQWEEGTCPEPLTLSARDSEDDTSTALAPVRPSLARLRVIGGFPEQEWAITTERATIGRAEREDICIPSHTVSRVHAVLEKRGDAWGVLDRGALNGTFVNGHLIRPDAWTRLADEDTLTVGGVELQFSILEMLPHPESVPKNALMPASEPGQLQTDR